MNKIYVFIVFLMIFEPVLAQRSTLRGQPMQLLRKKLEHSSDSRSRLDLQLVLGQALLDKAGGGEKEIDSSLKMANQAMRLSRKINDNHRYINAMLLIARARYKKMDINQGLAFAKQALAYGQKVNDTSGIAESYIVIADHYKVTNPRELAAKISYFDKAISLFRKDGNLHRLAPILEQQADFLFQAQRKTAAIKLLFEALDINKAIGNRKIQNIYCLIGRTSMRLTDFPNAIKYLHLALKTAKEVQDSTLVLCGIYNSIAVAYISMKDFNRAIPYSLSALEIAKRHNDVNDIGTVSMMLSAAYARTNRHKEAFAILREVEKTAHDDRDRLIVMVQYLYNLMSARQYRRQAAYYANKVIKLAKKMPPEDATLAPANNYLAGYYLEIGEIDKAQVYAESYGEIVNRTRYAKGIMVTEMYHYKIDSIRGNLRSAVNHYLAYQKIKDSTENVAKAYQISMLQIENDTEQKNYHIDTLTKQAQLKDSQLKRNEFIQQAIIGGSILLLIITGLIYSRYRLKQKTNRKLEANQRELDQKNSFLETMNVEQQKLIKEKEWLIKEVHHRVKNNLQMVTSLLRSQSSYLSDNAAILAVKDSLRRMQAMSMIHQQLYQDEKVSTIYMPEYIADLVRYLHDSFDQDERIEFCQTVDPLNLDISQAIPLALIVTESIVNTIKYAFINGQNGKVSIVLRNDGLEHLLLTVSDNGNGLPEGFNSNNTSKSFGLDLMQGLARQLKGTFKIVDDNGVQITVRFAIFKK